LFKSKGNQAAQSGKKSLSYHTAASGSVVKSFTESANKLSPLKERVGEGLPEMEPVEFSFNKPVEHGSDHKPNTRWSARNKNQIEEETKEVSETESPQVEEQELDIEEDDHRIEQEKTRSNKSSKKTIKQQEQEEDGDDEEGGEADEEEEEESEVENNKSRRDSKSKGSKDKIDIEKPQKSSKKRTKRVVEEDDSDDITTPGKTDQGDEEYLPGRLMPKKYKKPDENRVLTNERKEYTLFEDWKILEITEAHIMKNGPTNLMSRYFWEGAKDPKTKKKLFDGTRSAESLRERYKRFISNLTSEDMKQIRKFVADHNEDEEELRKYHTVWKTKDGIRRFTGISDELTYKPLKRQTPYGTKMPRKSTPSKSSKRQSKEKERVKPESSKRGSAIKIAIDPNLDESDIQVENMDAEELEEIEKIETGRELKFDTSFLEDTNRPVTRGEKKHRQSDASRYAKAYQDLKSQYEALKKQVQEARPVPTTLHDRLENLFRGKKEVSPEPEPQIVTQKAPEKVRPQYIIVKPPELPQIQLPPPKILKEVATNTPRIRLPNFKPAHKAVQVNLPINDSPDIEVQPMNGYARVRKEYDGERLIARPSTELKAVRSENYYHERSLNLSESMSRKKPLRMFPYEERLNIYVDTTAGQRFSLVEEPEYEGDNEEERDAEEEMRRLKALAIEYNVRFQDLLNFLFGDNSSETWSPYSFGKADERYYTVKSISKFEDS